MGDDLKRNMEIGAMVAAALAVLMLIAVFVHGALAMLVAAPVGGYFGTKLFASVCLDVAPRKEAMIAFGAPFLVLGLAWGVMSWA